MCTYTYIVLIFIFFRVAAGVHECHSIVMCCRCSWMLFHCHVLQMFVTAMPLSCAANVYECHSVLCCRCSWMLFHCHVLRMYVIVNAVCFVQQVSMGVYVGCYKWSWIKFCSFVLQVFMNDSVHVVFCRCLWMTVCLLYSAGVHEWQCVCCILQVFMNDNARVVFCRCSWLTMRVLYSAGVHDWQCACCILQVFMNDKKVGNELNNSHRKAVIPCRMNKSV